MNYTFDKSKPIIISLGGSNFSTVNGLDIEYLKTFTAEIRTYVSQGYRFVIVTGGGKICRIYQDAASAIGKPTSDDLDWVGIASTRINAQLLRASISDIAHPEIIENPTAPPKVTMPVVVGSGYIPGRSSDHDAVLLAAHYGAAAIINLGTADFVYSADPRTNPDATKFADLSWEAYVKIIPSQWKPGMNAPFDPIAAKEARELKLSVLIASGTDLPNLHAMISGAQASGTLIHP